MSFVTRVQSLGSHMLAAIRGPNGRDIPTPSRPAGGGMVTVRVQDLWSSAPSVGLTPARLAMILREADAGYIARAQELAEDVEAKSARILSGLQTRKRAVQRLNWTVTPASDSPRDVEIADFVRKNLTDCGLRKSVYHLLDAIYKGFATLWINWRLEGDKIWLGSLDWVPQRRWTFVPRDAWPEAPAPLTPRLLTDREPAYGEEVMPFSWVMHFDTTRSILPQKAGLWRTLVWLWMFSNFSLKDWLVFLDRYGQPFKLGKYPVGLDSAEVDVLKAAVQAADDSGAVINDQTLLEIIESKNTGTDMHERLLRYCDETMTLVILGQTASTQGTPGKLGNENAQSDVREDLVMADAGDLAETLQNSLIWPLVGWNFGWDMLLPQFAFTPDKIEDLTKKATTYQTLVNIGMPITVAQSQQEFGIRPPQGDEAILKSVGPSVQSLGSGALMAAIAAAAADATPITPQTDRLDENTTKSWRGIMDHIKLLVDQADSLPTLRDALLATYSELPSAQLSEVMAIAFAAADLAGRFDAEEEARG